ncbi:MAG: hypothetical protein K0Q72_198 [Armatimonadetes bacterium]|jgi:hypothetical protein|nr:hypothetical protein [Armatimonadota bacterium]
MKRLLPFLVLATSCTVPAAAWWPEGHSVIADGAVRSLPADVPSWFRAGGGLVAHLAQDPDVAKSPQVPIARDTEDPEHYLDFELLKGKPLPATRHEFLRLCARDGLDPKDVGTLPYAVAGWTERLAIAFAEHRKWPDNPHIRTKCQVYAGILSHYTGDLCMPLHTTIHHDGRARPDGTTPRSGIHARVDSLIEKVGLTPDELARDQKIEPAEQLLPYVVAEIEQSRALIDRTYELEPQLPPSQGAWKPSPEVLAYTRERGRESTRFTAALFLTAWRNSAGIKLPPWLNRK